MNDYEKLREALGDIANNPPTVIRLDVLKRWVEMVQEIANEALGDTAEESGVERLVVYLKEGLSISQAFEHQLPRVSRHKIRTEMYQQLLRHIQGGLSYE